MNKRFENIDREISRNRLWRAKEILQGWLSGGTYDAELFERMGRVLLGMGDMREAGKYLFLSGRRDPDYMQAIEIFLGSAPGGSFVRFWSNMPRRAFFVDVSDLPLQVQGDLEELGFSRQELVLAAERNMQRRAQRRAADLSPPGLSRSEKVALIVGLTVLVALVIGFVVQSVLGIMTLAGMFLAG